MLLPDSSRRERDALFIGRVLVNIILQRLQGAALLERLTDKQAHLVYLQPLVDDEVDQVGRVLPPGRGMRTDAEPGLAWVSASHTRSRHSDRPLGTPPPASASGGRQGELVCPSGFGKLLKPNLRSAA